MNNSKKIANLFMILSLCFLSNVIVSVFLTKNGYIPLGFFAAAIISLFLCFFIEGSFSKKISSKEVSKHSYLHDKIALLNNYDPVTNTVTYHFNGEKQIYGTSFYYWNKGSKIADDMKSDAYFYENN